MVRICFEGRDLPRLSFAFIVLILVISLFTVAANVNADNANFTVQPQKEHVISLDLKETDSVSGSFSVVSDDDTGIDFHVVNPLNQSILTYLNVKQRSFSFTVDATGTYQLHFDNVVSSNYSKTVALNCNITRYIMGMPQEQFLLIVVAIVALIGIVAYVTLMPK